ncbi:MAG: RNA polymerase sigma-54 factor [Rhodospirillales bacterium]|nr:MAG: RNA polymerase sigma-54 factor [Rhodospirillales bacterium]
MALTPRLDLRQSQTLVMTPQLQQAIKLLQLSNMELAVYVEQQVEQNPLLERDDAGVPVGEEGGAPAPAEAEADTNALRGLDRALSDTESRMSEVGASGEDLGFETGDVTPARDPADSALAFEAFGDWGRGDGGFDDGLDSLQDRLSTATTLRDHLTRQMAVDLPDPAQQVIGTQLIEMLDDAGYLIGDLAEVATTFGCDVSAVEEVLSRLQQFDPPGIFARSLAECLALQLRDREELDGAMRALLANLDLVALGDTEALAKACDVSRKDIIDMLSEIRSLNPKPGLAFDSAIAAPVTPDVIMRPQPGGGWLIELNTDTLPRVLVNNQYYARINSAAKSADDKRYINDCFQSANWLAKSLHQRATTILKVATEIVRQQEAFFVGGIRYLKPLILKDIAEAVGLHESTISRVTSNKYMATPRGILELKYFFGRAIGGQADSVPQSSEWIRHRIKGLIDAEPEHDVLSDDTIVTLLGREGIQIARRTVAKYRDAMGVPSSAQRRRMKRIRA